MGNTTSTQDGKFSVEGYTESKSKIEPYIAMQACRCFLVTVVLVNMIATGSGSARRSKLKEVRPIGQLWWKECVFAVNLVKSFITRKVRLNVFKFY